MITIVFYAFVALACVVALVDWRRGWLLAVLVGILQDPVRKLTPGSPVAMSFSIVLVYAAILFAAQRDLQADLREFSKRFSNVSLMFLIVLLFLVLAALNGIVNFGIAYWKVPLLSLFTYLAPIPAVIFGYAWLRDEERLFRFFQFYAIVTSVALVGAVIEYLRIPFPALGLVASEGDYIRHLPGLQIRMVTGFYRAPDIMGWHAATLTSIGIIMAVRRGLGARAWPWMLAIGWGFFNCLISGRRKAIYFVMVFAAIFLWRYFRRLRVTQVLGVLLAGAVMFLVVRQLSSAEESSVYTKGAGTSRAELTQRLEGGLFGTIEQVGLMGIGLGYATQGVHHLLPPTAQLGWQEGGLGKLAVEIGIPGLLAVGMLGIVMVMVFLKLTRIGDVEGSSQLARVALFALVMANVANFTASAQAYTDPVLALMTAFFLGCLFATATLDERLAAARPAAAPLAAGAPATATA